MPLRSKEDAIQIRIPQTQIATQASTITSFITKKIQNLEF